MRGFLPLDADVLLHHGDLVQGHVELVAVGVFDEEEVPLHAARRHPLDLLKNADAVVDVHDVVARLQVQERVDGRARFSS